jgi:Xaa-Pro aminopeptidase
MDTPITHNPVIAERIGALRRALLRHGLTAVVVPSSDPHISEYLPERWQARAWASGFSGSMGTLVVSESFAGLWADSRYWLQAETELAGSGISLMRIPTGTATLHVDWLATNGEAGQCVAVDGQVIGLAAARQLEKALTDKGMRLRSDLDLFAEVWTDRPPLPSAAIYEHLPPHATVSRADKLAALRRAMQEAGATHHFISTLDDLAYLLNLRGHDVEYNPVFLAHALVGPDQVTLFVGADKVDAPLAARLAADGVVLAPYAAALAALSALPADSRLLLDPRRVTLGCRNAVPKAVCVLEAVNPTTFAKSIKTPAEADGVRAAMAQDGAALCEFFAWFEGAVGRERITELTIDEKITEARARRPGFVCPSFSTIAGYNANGALPHYRATPAAHALIEGSGMLLIDSGGQYLHGTTDITRVVPVRTASADMRRDFTLVLKAMIALSTARFPRGTLSPMLDAIARAPIWAAGIDYGHGTGHGVGYFLNVHEGPQSISRTQPEAHMAMQQGMITSNEPGIYRAGRWGVRIENLVLTIPYESNEFGEFLQFETLTLCPIDSRLIEPGMLRDDERAWLNAYHASVRSRLTPHVHGDARAWLMARTEGV